MYLDPNALQSWFEELIAHFSLGRRLAPNLDSCKSS
jgi:hypothetical protein